MTLLERALHARRIACRNALATQGLTLEEAEHWCDAWEEEAGRRQLGRYAEFWQDGLAWITTQRSAKKTPVLAR
jgi:hypothetical protein